MKKKENGTILSFSLPFPWPFQEKGVFEINLKGEKALCVIENLEDDEKIIVPYRKAMIRKLDNILKSKDISSGKEKSYKNIKNNLKSLNVFSKSNIGLYFPYKIKLSEPFATTEMIRAKRKALKFTNRFIEVVKFYTGAPFMRQISDLEIEDFFLYYEGDPINKYKFITGASGGKSIIIPDYGKEANEDEMSAIYEDLSKDQELDFGMILLINAQTFYSQGNYRTAIIEAVTALEVTLAKFLKIATYQAILKLEEKPSYLEMLLDNFKAAGLSRENMRRKLLQDGKPIIITRIDKVLARLSIHKMLLIFKDLINKSNLLPEKKSFKVSYCMKALTIRNKIVHEGYKKVSSAIALSLLQEIGETICFIKLVREPTQVSVKMPMIYLDKHGLIYRSYVGASLKLDTNSSK